MFTEAGNGAIQPPVDPVNFDDFAAGRREYADPPLESAAPRPSVKPIPDELILEGAATLTAFGIPTVESQTAYEEIYKAQARPLLKFTRLGEALAEYGIGMPAAGGEAPAWLRIAMGMGGLAGIAYVLRFPERVPPALMARLAALGMQQQQAQAAGPTAPEPATPDPAATAEAVA